MACSSSNTLRPLLDEYVDGTLDDLRHARVEAHLATCDDCTTLLAELRVIDALLMTPRDLDPVPNFTFSVMAEVRPLPVPHRHHHIPFAAIGAYIVFAWVAIGGYLFFGGHAARLALASLGSSAMETFKGTGALAKAAGHVFGSNTWSVTATMGAVLGADLALAGLAIFAFAYVRTRRFAARENA